MFRRECLPLNLSPSSMVTQRTLSGLLIYVGGKELISEGWASQNMHIRTEMYGYIEFIKRYKVEGAIHIKIKNVFICKK